MTGHTAAVLRPTDLDGVRDAVRDTTGCLAITGAGTAAGWAGELGAVDAVLDVSGLTGVITHNPGDMTVSVHAGTPLRTLVAELADHGQHVSLDAARIADGATLGGLLATGDAGPSALVHGTLRDLVIGVTVVLADGTVAHSGGHVIKNVAGYDLSKLLHGSHGTLGVLTEVVLRSAPGAVLHPAAVNMRRGAGSGGDGGSDGGGYAWPPQRTEPPSPLAAAAAVSCDTVESGGGPPLGLVVGGDIEAGDVEMERFAVARREPTVQPPQPQTGVTRCNVPSRNRHVYV